MVRKMQNLNKELKILNFQFIMSLSKKPQLKVSKCLKGQKHGKVDQKITLQQKWKVAFK